MYRASRLSVLLENIESRVGNETVTLFFDGDSRIALPFTMRSLLGLFCQTMWAYNAQLRRARAEEIALSRLDERSERTIRLFSRATRVECRNQMAQTIHRFSKQLCSGDALGGVP